MIGIVTFATVCVNLFNPPSLSCCVLTAFYLYTHHERILISMHQNVSAFVCKERHAHCSNSQVQDSMELEGSYMIVLRVWKHVWES
jgi:hypothetical protein